MAGAKDLDRLHIALKNIRRGRSQIPIDYWAHGRDDLDVTQMSLLMVLIEHPDGLPIGDLADTQMLDAGNASRTARKLEEAGYVRRIPSPQDRRSVTIKLTAPGKSLGQKFLDRRNIFISHILGTFKASERSYVIDVVERIATAYQQFASVIGADPAPRPKRKRARRARDADIHTMRP